MIPCRDKTEIEKLADRIVGQARTLDKFAWHYGSLSSDYKESWRGTISECGLEMMDSLFELRALLKSEDAEEIRSMSRDAKPLTEAK